MESIVQSETVGTPIPAVQQTYNDKGSYLSKTYAEYNTSQKLQIEKSRLLYLKACRKMKRPPPSLRIRGCSAIDDFVKLPRFSALESEMLENAISLKRELIKHLEATMKLTCERSTKLSKRDVKKMKEHFAKKLKFYCEQNNTKWLHWPRKCTTVDNCFTKKVCNYKLRHNRRRRKTERDANRALQSSSVIVMVKEEIPLGAIALLGKGLNFIPTPSVCPRQEL